MTVTEPFARMEKGLDLAQAIAEADRCLLCHDAPCSRGCPAETDPGNIHPQAAPAQRHGRNPHHQDEQHPGRGVRRALPDLAPVREGVQRHRHFPARGDRQDPEGARRACLEDRVPAAHGGRPEGRQRGGGRLGTGGAFLRGGARQGGVRGHGLRRPRGAGRRDPLRGPRLSFRHGVPAARDRGPRAPRGEVPMQYAVSTEARARGSSCTTPSRRFSCTRALGCGADPRKGTP